MQNAVLVLHTRSENGVCRLSLQCLRLPMSVFFETFDRYEANHRYKHDGKLYGRRDAARIGFCKSLKLRPIAPCRVWRQVCVIQLRASRPDNSGDPEGIAGHEFEIFPSRLKVGANICVPRLGGFL